ncbi:MAG: hypothetical protein QOE22_619 [Candidatus Parcubacteria bacterium]|jgi:hypothetical protein|nr:hypothetical protein [Candidatus Parcubacteria bacterium]
MIFFLGTIIVESVLQVGASYVYQDALVLVPWACIAIGIIWTLSVTERKGQVPRRLARPLTVVAVGFAALEIQSALYRNQYIVLIVTVLVVGFAVHLVRRGLWLRALFLVAGTAVVAYLGALAVDLSPGHGAEAHIVRADRPSSP